MSGSCGASCLRTRGSWSRARDTGSAPRANCASANSRRCGRGDRLAAEPRWARHAPARHDQFALTIRAVAHDRSHLIGEDAGERREVAGPVVDGAEQPANGGLALGFRVQVAYVGNPVASILSQLSIVPDNNTQPHEPER